MKPFHKNFRISSTILLCSLLSPLFYLSGCGSAFTPATQKARTDKLIGEINELRKATKVPPLEPDEILMGTAAARAKESARRGKAEPLSDRLPTLVEAGCYARFALSHEVVGKSLEKAAKAILTDPLSKSKLIHAHLTSVGIGFAHMGTKVIAVVDLARAVSKMDRDYVRKNLVAQLELKRIGNSVGKLEFQDSLDETAQRIADRFMKGEGTSDALIAEEQKALNARTFDFGRVMVTFQVVGEVSSVVVPERTSDPSLAYVGVGFAQGNHPDHEPGSLAVVMILAEPQKAHDASRIKVHVPPPKSAPSNETSSNRSPEEQAWVATLTGNHVKAAKLFKKAYQQTKKAKLLYETARAYARNDDFTAALEEMRAFAQVAEGVDKIKAEKMIKKLEKGESIFSTDEKDLMSVEAKRFFLIGQRLYEQEEWAGAIDALQQAYTFSKHPDIVYNIGLTHLRAGNIGDALDFFGEYQRLVPEAENIEQARQFFQIGVELYQRGQFEAASRNFVMAYGFLPFPELIYNMALCYKALGENKNALRFLREFIDSGPTEKEIVEAEKMILELTPKKPSKTKTKAKAPTTTSPKETSASDDSSTESASSQEK